MKTADIGFERFEEDFYADLDTMYIKPNDEDLEQYTQIIKASSKKHNAHREEFLKNKKPLVMTAYERYLEKLNGSNQSE